MEKRWLRRLSVLLLALVFVGSGASALGQLYHQHLADQAYEEAAKIAMTTPSSTLPDEEVLSEEPAPLPEFPELPDPPVPLALEPAEDAQEPLPEEAQFLLELDLNTLQETNQDVLGWFYIPDTVISYPLMRSKDNNEYLTLTWDLVYNKSGSIFLECKNRADFSDFHTLIYGHNLQNGKMFSHLLHYQEQEYFDSHPCVYIATNDAILRYEVFSAYTADVVSDTYRLYFEDDTRKQSVIDFFLEKSELESDLVPTTKDRILTLSTCTGRGIDGIRWVVHTVLTGEFPR